MGLNGLLMARIYSLHREYRQQPELSELRADASFMSGVLTRPGEITEVDLRKVVEKYHAVLDSTHAFWENEKHSRLRGEFLTACNQAIATRRLYKTFDEEQKSVLRIKDTWSALYKAF